MEGIKGPWRRSGAYDVLDADGEWVAEIHGVAESWEPRARLIAQAPAMVDLIEKLLTTELYADGEGLVSFAYPNTAEGDAVIAEARALLTAIKGE